MRGRAQVIVRWTIGNEFLRRWMLENYQDLAQTLHSDVSDYGVESLLEMGRKVELDYLQHEISELKTAFGTPSWRPTPAMQMRRRRSLNRRSWRCGGNWSEPARNCAIWLIKSGEQ